MTTNETVTWRIRMLSDTGTALDYAPLYDCTEQQALIDAGAFAARMGSLNPRLVSVTGAFDHHQPPEATSPQTTPDNSPTSNNPADNRPTAERILQLLDDPQRPMRPGEWEIRAALLSARDANTEAERLRSLLREVVDHAFTTGVRSAVTVHRIRRVFDRAAAERGVVTGRPIGHAVTPGPGTGDLR